MKLTDSLFSSAKDIPHPKPNLSNAKKRKESDKNKSIKTENNKQKINKIENQKEEIDEKFKIYKMQIEIDLKIEKYSDFKDEIELKIEKEKLRIDAFEFSENKLIQIKIIYYYAT